MTDTDNDKDRFGPCALAQRACDICFVSCAQLLLSLLRKPYICYGTSILQVNYNALVKIISKSPRTRTWIVSFIYFRKSHNYIHQFLLFNLYFNQFCATNKATEFSQFARFTQISIVKSGIYKWSLVLLYDPNLDDRLYASSEHSFSRCCDFSTCRERIFRSFSYRLSIQMWITLRKTTWIKTINEISRSHHVCTRHTVIRWEIIFIKYKNRNK